MIDHLVFLVADLPAARRYFAGFGLPTEIGGRHPERGTHNALLRLGERSYLELLAVDPEAALPPPRWMGIDLPPLPRLARWAWPVEAGRFPERDWQPGSRRLADGRSLNWELTDPGVAPATEVCPFLIDWGGEGVHPADRLPDRGVRLRDLRLYHPGPEPVNERLRVLGCPYRVEPGPAARIAATLTTDRCIITLA